MSNLLKRTVFGALYVALVVASCLWLTPYCYGALFLLVSVLSVREFHHITHAGPFLTVGAMCLAALLFGGLWSWCCFSQVHTFTDSLWIVVAYACLLLLLLVAELFRKADDPVRNWGNLLMGQVMVALPFGLMNVLMSKSNMLLLALFVVIWLNDTGAYCVGSLIGRHKLIPRVSPGKTWEGLAGGALFGMLAGWILLADPWQITGLDYAWWQSLLLSFVIVVFGTLGDLTESLLKRTLGIKDSGNVLPGHGGFLDRFDSVLMATVALVLCLTAI